MWGNPIYLRFLIANAFDNIKLKNRSTIFKTIKLMSLFPIYIFYIGQVLITRDYVPSLEVIYTGQTGNINVYISNGDAMNLERPV